MMKYMGQSPKEWPKKTKFQPMQIM